ncbi:MAG TPA: RNA polymerase sigma factor [Solirubrobacteraceae bacterium]|jgi:RNA polymerase sigma-70 factor (ECF subfamily)|nr:RNA polymerase sigma factor [Solirubrobacteraceae bacterium]
MAKRDEQRFERLYETHFRRVAAYLLSRADRTVAEDALARTFEIAWRRLLDVPDEPLPWLLGVARKVLADMRRGQARQTALIERIAATVGEVQGDHAEALSGSRHLLAALQRLTDEQREVLLLVVWDELSQREAAAVLGCSRGAVALRLHRARARLRSALVQSATTEQAGVRPPPACDAARQHRPPSPHFVKETP